MLYRITELLTFRRGSSFIPNLIIATVPLLFALILQDTIKLFPSVSVRNLVLSAAILVIAYVTLAPWILLEAGRSTFSPKPHKFKFILASSALYLVLSAILCLIGYGVFIGNGWGVFLRAENALVGLNITILYALLSIGAHSSSVINTSRKAEKQRLVNDFLVASANIRSSSSVSEHSDTLLESGTILKRRLSEEPMVSEEFVRILESWLDEFEDYSTHGKIKMTGGRGGPSNLDEPWNKLAKDFEKINEELSVMHSQNGVD